MSRELDFQIITISSTSLALTYSGYGNLDIEMGAAGTPGTYTNPASITTNTYGQVTAVVSGTATPVAGSGSQYAVPIFTNSVTVGNSNITDTTSTINHTSVMDTLYVYGLARFKDVPAALNSDSIFTMGTTQHTLRAVHSPIAGFGQKISWPADSFWVDTAHIPTWYDTLSGNNWLASTYWVKQQGFGSGSVTSVATSTGLIGGTITTTGTLQIDSAKIPKWTDTLSGYNWLATSYWVKQQGYGTGSVTSVATYTATGLRGGTITTSGTLYIDSTLIPRWDDTLSGNQWLATNYWVKQQGYGAGTVTSVSGTTNQIDVASGTTTPVISIHSSAILPGSPTVATPGTAAGSIATIDGTQTLTNKTITSSTDVMGGVTMTLGSDASYDIYYRNSSGILTRLANGSAGQMLQSNFGAPTWVWPNFTQYNNQTGTSYTLVLADGWQWVTSNNSGAVTFTVPPNSSVAYAVGTIIQFQNYGAGKLTFSPGAGVTINSDGTFLSVTQNRGAYLQKTATNVWILAGGISN